MPIPHLVFIGADKGGVGKTVASRLLLDYYKANAIEFKAFDTQFPSGGLQRFYPEKAQIVDITKSDDQMKVLDDLQPNRVNVVDGAAGTLTPTLKLLNETGFLDDAKVGKLKIIVLHVLGPATQSLDEVKQIVAALAGSRYIAVANHIDDTAYAAPAEALKIEKLDGEAAKAVDATALPYSEFIDSGASRLLRGKVRFWRDNAFAQFNAAKLNVLA